MVIKNLSTRQITLRDEDGNLYVIPSLGESVLSDDLIEDNTFKRWLRWRLRDIYISPFVNIEKNSVAVDSKPTINFIEGNNTTLTTTVHANSIDILIDAAADVDWNNLSNVPTVFPIAIAKAGASIGTRTKINFIEGSNITLTVADNPGSARVDVTINATGTLSVAWTDISGKPTTFAPSGHQSSHQAGGSDALAGNLNATARLAIQKSAAGGGTRRKINFIEGSGISLTLADDSVNEKVDVTIAANALAPSTASYITMVAESGLSAETVLNVVIGKGTAGAQPATSDSGKGRLYYIEDVGSRRLTRDGGVAFGWQDLYYDWDYVQSKPTTFAPSTHATSHQSGGSDPIKLDDLSAPDDTTDLDVSGAVHGLLPKLPMDSAKFFNGVGQWVRNTGSLYQSRGTLVNTTSETSLASYTIPGGTFGITSKLYVELMLGLFHNDGSGRDIPRIRLKFGSTPTTILDFGVTGVNALANSTIRQYGVLRFEITMSGVLTSQVVVSEQRHFFSNINAGGSNPYVVGTGRTASSSSDGIISTGSNAVSGIDFASDQLINVTCQITNGGANYNVLLENATWKVA